MDICLFWKRFNLVLYLRFCSFLRGNSTKIFARLIWVISSFILCFKYLFDDEGGEKTNDKCILFIK